MARVGTQSAVVNFSGGLVTEASPLTFPENSLSTSKNVEIDMDGTLKSRRPFQKTETSYVSGLNTSAGYIKIKKYSWREKDRQVLVFIEQNAYTFKILDANGTNYSGRYTLPAGVTLNNPELINVSFVDNHFFFTVNVRDATSSYVQNISLLVKGYYGVSNLLFSDYYTATEATYNFDREPTSGYSRTYTLHTEVPFVGMVDTMSYGWVREEIYNSNGTYICRIRLRWNSGNAKIGSNGDTANDIWSTSSTSSRLPIPPSVTVGDYTYYSDAGSEVVTREASQPSTDFDIRYTVRGAWRSKKGSYVKISKGSQPLRYRDFAGLPNVGSMGMDSIIGNDERHIDLTAFNAYNLYNAGWKRGTGSGMLVSDEEGSTVSNVGESYVKRTKELVEIYPSLSDSQFDFITDDASNTKAIGLYSPFLLSRNKPYTSMARRGSNILTLYREYDPTGFSKEHGSYFIPNFYSNGTLPFTTEFNNYIRERSFAGRITASEYINGRMWYGVTGRDFNVMFSQIDYEGKDFANTELGNLVNCYQQGDPNDEYNSSLLATDGGTMVLKDVGTIHSFKAFRQYILVFASEGVWAISGGSRDSFSPTSFSVSKLSSEGVSHNEAVVTSDNEVYYVSHKSLNSISLNRYDVLEVTDLSSDKVLTSFQTQLRIFNHSNCRLRGLVYDAENKRVIINHTFSIDNMFPAPIRPHTGSVLGTKSVVYDVRLGAFYEWDSSSVRVQDLFFTMLCSNIRETLYVDKLLDPSTARLSIDLGVVEFRRGIASVHHDVSIVVHPGNNVNFTFNPANDEKLYLLTQVDDATAHVDSPWHDVTTIGDRHFPVDIVVPYDTSKVPFVDKSVRTLSFFQELSRRTVLSWSGNNQMRVMPTLELTWEWDWDKSKGGSHELVSNIRYPENMKVVDMEVGVSKTRLTGFGKALTLRVRPSLTTPISFKILGYFTEASMAGRS